MRFNSIVPGIRQLRKCRLPPKADIHRTCRDVRFVPKADKLLLLVTRPIWRPGHIGLCQLQKRALLDATVSVRPHDAVGLPAQLLHVPDPMDTPSSRTDRVRFATVPASRERRSRTPP